MEYCSCARIRGRRGKMFALLLAYGSIRRAMLPRAASLDLDENQFLAMPSDDVGLGVA